MGQGQAGTCGVTRRRRPPPAFATYLLALAALTMCANVLGRPAPKDRAPAQRPADAPVPATQMLVVPRLPAEYLQHDVGGIRFAYHPSTRDRVRTLIESAQQVRADLRQQLARPVLASVDVRVAITPSDVARIVPILTSPPKEPSDGAQSGPGGAAAVGRPGGTTASRGAHPSVAYSSLALLVINLGAKSKQGPPDALTALRHGMAHLALDEALGQRSVPKWLHEGFAASFEPPERWPLGWAALRGALIPVEDLDWYPIDQPDQSPLARAEAADFVRFLRQDAHQERFGRLVSRLQRGEPWPAALSNAYGRDRRALEEQWRGQLAKHKVFAPLLGFGSLLTVLLVGAVVLVRRWRRRRAKDRRVIQDMEESARRVSPRVAIVQVERTKDPKGPPEMPIGEAPESGIPKVSHKGSWHTLH